MTSLKSRSSSRSEITITGCLVFFLAVDAYYGLILLFVKFIVLLCSLVSITSIEGFLVVVLVGFFLLLNQQSSSNKLVSKLQ